METQLVKLEIPEPHVGTVTIDNPPLKEVNRTGGIYGA